MIDAHQHFWSVARGDYGWLTPETGVLYRDYGPEDLAPHLERQGIEATILVQAAETEAETRYLLSIARRTSFVAGVVGWVDLASTDAAEAVARAARDPLLVGLRPMVQDIADDDWLLRPDLRAGIEAMQAHGLVFDALIHPRHLPRLAAFLERYPGLPVVLDHGAKPFIAAGRMEPWQADIAAIAARPQTLCKLSGLATEAAADWRVDDLRPYVDHLIASFGSDRLMWGSDWPVVERAGGYERWRSAAEALLSRLGEADRAAVLGGNAERFYLNGRGRPPPSQNGGLAKR